MLSDLSTLLLWMLSPALGWDRLAYSRSAHVSVRCYPLRPNLRPVTFWIERILRQDFHLLSAPRLTSLPLYYRLSRLSRPLPLFRSGGFSLGLVPAVANILQHRGE